MRSFKISAIADLRATLCSRLSIASKWVFARYLIHFRSIFLRVNFIIFCCVLLWCDGKKSPVHLGPQNAVFPYTLWIWPREAKSSSTSVVLVTQIAIITTCRESGNDKCLLWLINILKSLLSFIMSEAFQLKMGRRYECKCF